jgi:hypothetical protein
LISGPASKESLQLQGQVLYQHQNIGFGVRFTESRARQQMLELLLPFGAGNESSKLLQSTSAKLATQYN